MGWKPWLPTSCLNPECSATEGIFWPHAAFSSFVDPRRSISYACGRQSDCGLAWNQNLPSVMERDTPQEGENNISMPRYFHLPLGRVRKKFKMRRTNSEERGLLIVRRRDEGRSVTPISNVLRIRQTIETAGVPPGDFPHGRWIGLSDFSHFEQHGFDECRLVASRAIAFRGRGEIGCI